MRKKMTTKAMRKKMTKGTSPLDQVRDNKQMRHHNTQGNQPEPQGGPGGGGDGTILHWEKIIFKE